MNREPVLLTAAALLAAASRLFAQDSAWVAEGLQGKAVYSLALAPFCMRCRIKGAPAKH